jgi:hypothetical protein
MTAHPADVNSGFAIADAWLRFKGRSVAVFILAGFGAYSMYGCTRAAVSQGRPAWYCAIGVVTAIQLVWAIAHLILHRRVPKPEFVGRFRKFYAVRFLIILATEVTGIVLAGPVLAHFHRTDLVPQWINLVVGVHFLPLGKLFRMSIYYATSAAIVASSLGSLLTPTSSLRLATNSGGTGLALWVTAFIIISKDAARLRATPASR